MKIDPRVQPSAKQWPRLCKPGVQGVREECPAEKKQQRMRQGMIRIYKGRHFEFSSSFIKNQNKASDLFHTFTVICFSTAMQVQECTANASTCFQATKLER